jgi:hypothetical protein
MKGILPLINFLLFLSPIVLGHEKEVGNPLRTPVVADHEVYSEHLPYVHYDLYLKSRNTDISIAV